MVGPHQRRPQILDRAVDVDAQPALDRIRHLIVDVVHHDEVRRRLLGGDVQVDRRRQGTDAARSMRPQPCFMEGGGSMGQPSDSNPVRA